MESDIRIISAKPYFSHEKCRTPIKFGSVVMEESTYFHAKVTVENRAGKRADGYGAILLADFWAFPTRLVSHEDKDKAMREVSRAFCKLAETYKPFAHPVDIFLDLEDELRRVNEEVSEKLNLAEKMPFLGALVSASPVDAAIHDAFGTVNGISSYDGYGAEFMEHDAGYYLGEKFRGRYLGDYFRKQYDPEVPIFHLVGGLDKLTQSEVSDDAPQDGLPNSLDEWIERDGLFCLKVKLRGNDLRWDIDRIKEVVRIAHEVQDEKGRSELYFSADANEQCDGPKYVMEMLAKLREEFRQAYDELLYIEQPVERDLALRRFDMRRLSKIKPVVVDESLTGLDKFDLAMELGWSGIALKTCKCQSNELLFVAKATEEHIPYAVQDLANPGIALIHSVGLAARTSPIKGVEANSRQFFPTTSEPEARVHPDIFRAVNGIVRTDSLRGCGLGYQMDKVNRIFEDSEV